MPLPIRAFRAADRGGGDPSLPSLGPKCAPRIETWRVRGVAPLPCPWPLLERLDRPIASRGVSRGPRTGPPVELRERLASDDVGERILARYELAEAGYPAPGEEPDPEALRERDRAERARTRAMLEARRRARNIEAELEAHGLARLYFTRNTGTTCETVGAQQVTAPERLPFPQDDYRKGVAWALRELGERLEWPQAEARASRWEVCACGSIELHCSTGGHGKDGKLLAPIYCDLRVCPRCARRRAGRNAKVQAAVLERAVELQNRDGGRDWTPETLPPGGPRGRRWMMVTLTRKNTHGWDPELLRAKVHETKRLLRDLVRETWGHYRAERVTVDEAGVGGVWGLEAGGSGMVHVHMLVYGHYWPQEELAGRWERLTGDSYVVHIEAVKPRPGMVARMRREEGRLPTASELLAAAVKECLKYSRKPPEAEGPEAFRALAALEYALAGMRRLGSWGIFYGQIADTLEDPEFSPDLERAACPCCGSPLLAGAILGPGYTTHLLLNGAASWLPSLAPQPPPEETT